MLIKRNVYFSQIDENGEERLFSTNERSTDDKLKTTGKVAMGIGAGTALTAGLGENVIADKVIKKVAEKNGVTKYGYGASSFLHKVGPNAQKDVDRAASVASRAIKSNKNFKRFVKADKIGTGIALTGAGLYTAGKLIKKKKENNDMDK